MHAYVSHWLLVIREVSGKFSFLIKKSTAVATY